MPDGSRPDSQPSAIYIAAPEGDTGKSTIALGIMHRLAATVAKVGVFRPITRLGEDRDYILELLLAHSTAGLPYERCVGVTYQQLHADIDAALADIVDRYHAMADACDAVVIVGSDYTDVASPAELSVNARIAVNLGAPVLLVVRASGRTAEDVAHVAVRCLDELAAQHAHTAAVVANRCEPSQLSAVAEALRAFAPQTYVLPNEPLLAAPTVAELQKAVNGTLVSGDAALMGREVLGVVVAGMTAEHVLERLGDGVVVITPGDRSDVVLAVASAHGAEGFPSLSCIILNGGFELHPSIAALVAGLRLRLPIITTTLGTFETASAVASVRGRVTAGSLRKIDTALELMERHVDIADLLAQLAIPIPTVTTPQMFTYRLRAQARADRRHIVLPEGGDDRILKSAGRVLQRGIADLTILGDELQIRLRAAELGVDLDDAAVIDPRTSELSDQFADQYAELRKAKGITVEQAREIMYDASYFGTMLVYNGMVDGMVSGAAHTTAHTVRPAFEIIKTVPDVATVSSVFLMCLPDQVLAYGDCAIVPDPTPEQLADIAISSARTAAQFGIEPAGGHAVLFHRRLRRRCRRRQGQGGNGIGASPRPAPAGRGPHPVRRRDRTVRRGHQVARFAGGRPRHGADLPRPQHRQQHLQGGAAQCRRDRDRAGAAGVAQAGERPVPGRAGRRHRQHRRDHRDSGAGDAWPVMRSCW